MKNLFFSAFAVLIGTGAAFATNGANKSKSTVVDGHYFDNNLSKCVNTEQDCSTEFNIQMCTWGEGEDEIVLREAGSTTCGNQLYKVPEN